ncbi:hypothetical protein T440DRAFT_267374 [Plenodomus tracheiphilus IPT5]|uniref:Uncharacterized protein n=1 Tax=Plenodomus tracheiphilus IPT5 TaxID=1408161 RepID=A0A6A7BEZ9_9PLEO|nr:hypothetical protein T440DRAFT_267374 [Plenodomus tracheiphilus IPT5]
MLTLALYPTGRPGEYRRIGFAEWKNCSWYGYYCLGDDYDPKYWQSLRTGHLIGGWRMFVRELFEVIVILIFGTLFQQSMIHLERDGVVWFRELARGKRLWRQHDHSEDAHKRERYRRGWEPKTEFLTII